MLSIFFEVSYKNFNKRNEIIFYQLLTQAGWNLMKIYACPKCGSRNIGQGAMDTGFITGHKDVCKNCGYQGMPLLFYSKKEYENFIEELSQEKTDSKSENHDNADYNSLSEKDKDFIKFVKDSLEEEEKQKRQKRPYGLVILVFITILYTISISSSLIFYPVIMLNFPIQILISLFGVILFSVSVLSIIAIPYGFLKGKSWAYTLSGLLFVMALPIGLIFLYYLTRPHVKAHFGKT
jgi:predicted RNA-binding Zn-ribbon protein involved in translation (DUF1610 family)